MIIYCSRVPPKLGPPQSAVAHWHVADQRMSYFSRNQMATGIGKTMNQASRIALTAAYAMTYCYSDSTHTG